MEYKQVKGLRAKTRDVAFQFRMGAGFPGDVNRTHPAEIEAALVNVTTPPLIYGQVLIVDGATSSVRPVAAGDQSNTVPLLPFGALVRPYPLQQMTATNYGAAALGAAVPPTSGVVDAIRSGLIMVQLNVGVTAPQKGGAVYVWAAATSGNHIQGGYETAYSAGNTVLLDPRFTYNGPADASGVTELSCNV